ncbi:single-stranded DNA-binding protein (plasmid) [Methylocaldum sp. MU1018]|jgi:single-strand DNA-binding protein|uniref:single-stranded DNA-binding protein n=1 Tax=Aeromonas veronii TaxID=654 RepID=UPI000C7774C1|nr:single-stranded DNA-binding protein [Aeromonas veronii]AYK20465.1 single-stranded DNA-binding protein [Aeromonas veronii]
MSRINNSFRFTGNLGTDPEVRYNPNNGDPIASIPLAVDASYKNRETGEKVEKVDWFDLTIYYKGLVDVVQKYTRKGSQIQVRGNMRKRVWESKDRKDGEGRPIKESRIEFVVTEIMLLGRPKDDAAPEPGSTYTVPEGVDPAPDFDDDIPL